MDESRTPTPREMAILKTLWELGPSSVRDVHRSLSQDESIGKELAYNTVQTLMRIMEEKGLIDHHLEGRSFIYTARFSRDEMPGGFSIGCLTGRRRNSFPACCGRSPSPTTNSIACRR